MINYEADEVIKERFDSFKNRYQNNLESIEGTEFVFDYADSLCYKYHKIYRNCGGSNVDSPDWIKSKKATIGSINKKDDRCFQYPVTVALNHKDIGQILNELKKLNFL